MKAIREKVIFLALVTLLFGLWTGVGFWTFGQIQRSTVSRKHASSVLNRANSLMSDLKDAETSQRGFLLTGDDLFLDPYANAGKSISKQLETLHQLASIPAAQKRLDALTPIVAAKIAEMAQVIELRRTQGLASAQKVVASAENKHLMDSIRSEMNSFVQIEEDALANREEKLQTDMRHLLVFLIGASLLALLFSVLFAYYSNREAQHRKLRLSKTSEDAAGEFAESLINTVREPLISLDQDLRVVAVSRSFYDVFKVKPEDTVGQLIYDLGNKQWDIPKLRELLETILPRKATFDNYEVEHDFAGIGRRTMLLNARQIKQVLGKERIILLAIEDITERKAIEAGLEQTRKDLAVIKKLADETSEFAESVINTVREPLISLDQDLRVVSVSRSFYDFFKVKPEDTVGRLIYDLGNKQWDIPKLRELLETILPQKATFDNYEVEHDFAGIGRRTMLLNARQIEQVLGKERIILLAIEDITERKSIEAGLEQTRKDLAVIKKLADETSEFAESVINTVREPLISLDQDLRVVSVSRSFYDFFKVKPEDTVGRLIYDLGNKQWDIPKLRELLETILPQKASFDNYEVEHDFAGVGRRTMLLNARQIEQVLGKERIILLAIEDITERKAIEAGLEKTRKDLAVIKQEADEASAFSESVINTVREPLISLDQDLRVVAVSRSFYDFFKVKPEDTVGQLIYDLGNKQWDIPKLRDLLETILPQKASFDNYEVEHDFAGVGRRTMLLNARQIERVLDKERIILLAIEDITERKEIEAGLEQTRKDLVTANKELEAFTYSVSHDLRAPLRGVVGFSRILIDEYASNLSPDIQRYLNLVLSNTLQMGRLVDDLLSFSRFSRQAMATGLVDPVQLVREAMDLLGGEQPDRPVKLTVGDLPPCRGDRTLLKQVFVNLLSNALKFTRQRDPARIEVGVSRKDREIVYFVRDNGAGFDMRHVNKLFGVFQRLHSAEVYEGTGVGLAIVQRIVHRHGGRVWAEGEPDKGATFYFTLGGTPS